MSLISINTPVAPFFLNRCIQCLLLTQSGHFASAHSRNARLSCMRFAANAVRLQLHALAYNLDNFLRTLATPQVVESWSLTTLRERLIKTGVRMVRHARYAVFQFAEAALPRDVFAGVLDLINGLRGPPAGMASA